MPTVPTQFVPQVDMQAVGAGVPYQAPPVESVRNATPEQQVRFGQAMTGVGNALWSVGQQVQDTIDEAQAKKGDNEIVAKWNEILVGANGYLNTEGESAKTQYEATKNALASAANGVIDGLENDTQKTMLKIATARNLNIYNAKVSEHYNKQAREFEIGESATRAQTYTNLAADAFATRHKDTNFDANCAVVLWETNKVGAQRGFPEGSWQMKAMEQAAWGGIAQGVVNRMSITGDFESASKYVKKLNEEQKLKPEVAQQLLTYVDQHRDQQLSGDYANSIVTDGVLKSPSHPGTLTLPATSDTMQITWTSKDKTPTDSVFISVPPKTPITAPQDSVVTKIESVNGVSTVHLRTDDGTEVAISGIHDSHTLVKGLPLGRGQQLGMALEEPFQYSATRNGNPVNVMQSDEINPSHDKKSPPTTEREAIYIAGAIDDPDLRKLTITKIKGLFDDRHALRVADEQNAYMGIMKQLAVPVVLDIPPGGGPPNTRPRRIEDLPYSLLASLSPEGQSKLATQQLEQDDIGVRLDIAQNPELLNTEYLMRDEVRSKLTPETHIQLMEKANNPERVFAATVDADMVDLALVGARFKNIAFPDTDTEKEQELRLRESLEKIIDQQQREKKRTLTKSEKQAIVDEQIIMFKTTYDYDEWFGIENEVPLALVPADELAGAVRKVGKYAIPIDQFVDYYNYLTLLHAERGQEKPTEGDVLKWYLLKEEQKKKGKP